MGGGGDGVVKETVKEEEEVGGHWRVVDWGYTHVCGGRSTRPVTLGRLGDAGAPVGGNPTLSATPQRRPRSSRLQHHAHTSSHTSLVFGDAASGNYVLEY